MIKLKLVDSFMFGGPLLYLVEQDEHGVVTHVGKPVDLVMEPYNPALSLSHQGTFNFRTPRETEVFLQSVVDELAQRKKPSPTDNRLLGQLEATQAHLHDLRIMLDLHRKERL